MAKNTTFRLCKTNIVLNKFKKKKKEVDIMAKNAYISRVSYQLVY